MITQPIIGISSEDHKLASLFFEKIIPLYTPPGTHIPEELIFPITLSDEEKFGKFQKTEGGFSKWWQDFKRTIRTSDGKIDYPTVTKWVNVGGNIIALDLHNYLNKKGIPSVPIFYTQQDYDSYLPNGTKESVEISLMRAPLIDTSNVEWKSILDIRKDKDFKRKLRNFRLFINENYQGKSPIYVRDSLEKKMEEYEDACRKHGLQLVLSSVSQTLDSKSMLGYLGLITVGIITGQPNIVSTTIIGGTIIEIGKITIQVTQKHFEYISSRQNTELAYLIKLKNMFD
jgi:hypothetical protein